MTMPGFDPPETLVGAVRNGMLDCVKRDLHLELLPDFNTATKVVNDHVRDYLGQKFTLYTIRRDTMQVASEIWHALKASPWP